MTTKVQVTPHKPEVMPKMDTTLTLLVMGAFYDETKQTFKSDIYDKAFVVQFVPSQKGFQTLVLKSFLKSSGHICFNCDESTRGSSAASNPNHQLYPPFLSMPEVTDGVVFQIRDNFLKFTANCHGKTPLTGYVRREWQALTAPTARQDLTVLLPNAVQ